MIDSLILRTVLPDINNNNNNSGRRRNGKKTSSELKISGDLILKRNSFISPFCPFQV